MSYNPKIALQSHLLNIILGPKDALFQVFYVAATMAGNICFTFTIKNDNSFEVTRASKGNQGILFCV